MSLTINAKVYTADAFASDSIGYIGPLKTTSVKDDAVLRRLAIKPTTVFSGVSRTYAKLTRTLALTGALTPSGDAFVNVEVMVPVGFAAADVDALLNDMGSLVASVSFKTHVKSRAVSF